ncbi:MAG: hypothetical protein SFU57_08835 [Gemmatimonadales bacterium]|nr:hypothetical protein [Gemmatimonadales bacterium]
MAQPYGTHTASPATRPTISDLRDGPDGRSFSVHFLAGQRLPDHRNASRIRILAVEGEGMIIIEGLGARTLGGGEAVQLEANVTHSLEACSGEWQVEVVLLPACCPGCA